MAKVLLIGSGGREHSIAWKLSESKAVKQVLVAPGNGGTSQGCGNSISKISNVPYLRLEDYQKLAEWCIEENISLVVVGPEVPLANGISDILGKNGIKCFGPSQQPACLESSKDFAKRFMVKNEIPTARYQSFTNAEAAVKHIRNAEYPALVVKASGLAAGKGVVVASSKEEACSAVKDILEDKIFGSSGEVVVIEELLEGEEFSVLCFTDGDTIAPMPPTQDHKRAYEGDQGPNTGGMGAYGPCPQIDQAALENIHKNVLQKTVDGMRKDGIKFVGVLYAGIMMTQNGPKVLEFNCRFGDPECQVLMSLLDSDLYETMVQCCEGNLNPNMVQWKEGIKSACIVLASKGYPGKYEKGKIINGIDSVNKLPGLRVYEAGTKLDDAHQKITSGGRVLAVTSSSPTLKSALELASKGVKMINFDGKFYRKDIGWRGLAFSDKTLSYADCGVDINRGDAFVEAISKLASCTSRKGCDVSLGGFGAVFDLAAAGYTDPVLVSGTDGVGTKLLLAQESGDHTTIGQDLVAMCVNDILTHNAEPLFFLDYFSTGILKPKTAKDIVAGIAEGCKMAGCALAGGETAEMPGMYTKDHYDLAGFAVGAYDRKLHKALPALQEITEGDVIIGISSTGIHSNGYSLVREVVKRSRLNSHDPAPFESSKTLVESLLTPTAIYPQALLPVMRNFTSIKAAAHITGGGLPGNLSRVIPDNFRAVLDATSWSIRPVFGWLAKTGNVAIHEMYRTFNCGLGMCLIVAEKDWEIVLENIEKNVTTMGLKAFNVGRIEKLISSTDKKVVVRNLGPTLLNSWKQDNEKLNGNALKLNDNVSNFRDKPSVAVFISGSGTNLQSLIDHEKSGKASYKISLVISNKAKVPGLQRASDADIPCMVVNNKNHPNREEYDKAIHEILKEKEIDLICLAGFMRLLSGWFTHTWEGKILNIHPSLLPAFKGMDAHKQVIEAGVRVTGCTVHFVTEKMDDGAIIAQAPVSVKKGDTVNTLSERVKITEHKTYPYALDLVAKEEVKFDSKCNKVIWG